MKPYYNFLLNGPIGQEQRRRQELIERMAKDLLKAPETLVDDWDAVQFLRSRGYGPVDVAVVAGEARYLACQELFAREMSKP